MKRLALATCLAASIVGGAAESASAATPKLNRAELTWVTPLLEVWVAQNAALRLVSKTAAAKNALYLNTANNKKLAVVVGTLLSCKKPKDQIVVAGQAPTARMRTFGTALNSACIHDEAGANAFAKAMLAYTAGKAKLTGQFLNQGIAEFKLGTTQLRKAYVLVTAAGGSKVFTA
jgi:hypothetical protein